jgi:type 1 glutamine amidotransferase
LQRGGEIFLGVLAVLVGALAIKLRMDGFFREPVYETVAPNLPDDLQHPAILVFSKTNGFIHKEAIPAAQALFKKLGKANGWNVYLTDNAAVHNPQDLQRFDALVWNNVSGDVLTAEQRTALEQYLENGGGFVGIHGSGGDPSYAWPWYPQSLLHAQFTAHPLFPQFQQATLNVESPQDAIVSQLPASFSMTDEWYSFSAPPQDVEVLLSLDEKSYSPKVLFHDIGMGADHPIAWKHCLGKGRVFYGAPGHLASSYSDPRYAGVLEKATQWAMQPDPACK